MMVHILTHGIVEKKSLIGRAKNRIKRDQRRQVLRYELLEDRRLLASDWQNAIRPGDVDANGVVTASDALSIINELVVRQFSQADGQLVAVGQLQPLPFLDVNGDGRVTASDALGVINVVNRGPLLPIISQLTLRSDSSVFGTSNSDRVTRTPDIVGVIADEDSPITKLEARLDAGNFEVISFDAAGTFTLTPNLAIDGSADGLHTVRVRATDSGGSVSSDMVLTFTLDTTPPTTPTLILGSGFDSPPVGDNQTSLDIVVLNGVAEPGTQIRLEPGNRVTTADASGAYSYSEVPLRIGANVFTVSVSDVAGNVSSSSLTIERTSNAGGPSLQVNGSLLRTTNTNLTVTGVVGSSATQLVGQLDLSEPFPITFNTQGEFTFTTNLPVSGSADGTHLLRIRGEDADGDQSPLVTINWIFDTQSPLATTTFTGIVRNKAISIPITFAEPLVPESYVASNFSLAITSGPQSGQTIPVVSVASDAGNVANLTLARALENVSYRLNIGTGVVDAAGNQATPISFDFTVAQPARVTELSPSSGEEMVSLTRETVARFDTEVDPATITDQSFYLLANSQRVPGHIRVSSTNRFATFFYDTPLPASSAVRVVVDGNLIMGRDGLPVDADADSEPGGILKADFRTLPITLIPGTRIFGYIYDSYNRNTDGSNIPVVGATISLDARPDIRAVTDATGFFELGLQDLDNNGVADGLPAPEFFVHIDGSTAINAPAGAMYATLGKPFHTIPGQRSQLEMPGGPDVDPNTPGEQFHIFLPPMSMGDIVTLNPTEDTIVGFGPDAQAQIRRMMTERYPNDPAKAAQQAQLIIDTMQVTYPAGSAMNEDGTPATRATIVPVDPQRLPAPLPPGANPGLVISVQAGTTAGFNLAGGSTNFDVSAPVRFPNLDGLALGCQKVGVAAFLGCASFVPQLGSIRSSRRAT